MTVSVRDFVLPKELEAHEPPEARGLPRDRVRLMVSSSDGPTHHAFADLPCLLRAGDALVVNTSATLPAAVPTVDGLFVHFSTERPDGRWLVELRRDHAPYAGTAGRSVTVRGGATVTLDEPFSFPRLWLGRVSTPDVPAYLSRHGQPIRYSHVRRDWPLSYYQTVFASHPGSAEMPSAGRPFTDRIVTRLVTAGVLVLPLLLHTGVASPEAHERPYPEWFAIPSPTARALAAIRAAGGRVIAVGTTVVRALETTGGEPGEGWTDLVVTPESGVRVVDGLLTGFHEPRASHLDLLAAVAGPSRLVDAYAEALRAGYRWHEFGDAHLLWRP